MFSAIFDGIGRHPRSMIGGVVLIAVGSAGVQLLAAPDSDTRYAIPAVLSLLVLASSVLSLVALARPRPAAFVVDARSAAFRTVSHPRQVLARAAAVLISTAQATSRMAAHAREGDPAWDPMSRTSDVLAAVLVVLAALLVAAVWRGSGLWLRQDGLTERNPLGSVTVPWDALSPSALPPTTPSAWSLRLGYAKPELVRRRGLASSRRISTDTVNALFLVHTLHYYLTHPEQRQAIGTESGYADLLRVLYGATPRQPVDGYTRRTP
ncbi:hypothetical protein GCM10009827_071910 [Dactylosporangium maewongense]|uniref:DUF4129 domain-containing protein n=1 Tax=Dactylosporangium maewongense TaxID=634393 RepID=A0ABN2BJ15_9ACTN